MGSRDNQTSEENSPSTTTPPEWDESEDGFTGSESETISADGTSRTSAKGKGKVSPKLNSTASESSTDRNTDNENMIGRLNNLISTDMDKMIGVIDLVLCESQ